MAAEESAGADVEVHVAAIKAQQVLGKSFEGQCRRTGERVLPATVQKQWPNAVVQTKIAEALAAEHVDGWADELAVSKVEDGRDIVAG